MMPEPRQVDTGLAAQAVECLMDGDGYREISHCIDAEVDNRLFDLHECGASAEKCGIGQLQDASADGRVFCHQRADVVDIRLLGVTGFDQLDERLGKAWQPAQIQQ